MKKQPNPIDVKVGANIRARRVQLGMSQEELGKACGITFQQIQKYEKGTNRVGSSRLHEIATALKGTPALLFEGAGVELAEGQEITPYSNEAIRLATMFDKITTPGVKAMVLKLVRVLAKDETE